MISMKIDNQDVIAALLRAPRTVEKHIGRQLRRAALEVASEARRVVPKAFSTLEQSIRASRISPFEYHVTPGVNYALAVEEGTGPAAGKARYFPNPDALRPWVERVTGARGREAENKAFLIARSIARHGTKAQAYMEPTAEKMGDRVIALVRQGVADGLHEAGIG